MAKQGFGKQHKVISSGRLIGSARGPGGKKKVSGKRPSLADPCYSLYSTDSEDQVTTIHKGLDRCAALLNGILQSEKAETNLSCTKHKISAQSKTKTGKGETANKRHTKRIVSVSQAPTRPAPVQKTVLSSQSYPGVKKENHIHSTEAPVGQSALVSGTRLSPRSRPVSGQHTHPQPGLHDSHPGPGLQNATVFNCRLTTSTPTLSPERPTLSVYTASDPTQMVFPAQHNPRPDIQEMAHHRLEAPAHVQPPCSQSQLGVDVSASATGSVRPEQMALTGESSEYSEESASEEGELDHTDVTPVRDTACQTSFEKRKLHTVTPGRSPEKTVRKVMTVRHLLQELKAIVAERADCEALRLITEVEQSVDLLPVTAGGTNVQAEIALAVQPLRSENAQLRRRLRIVNQQLMERERAEKEARPADCNFEIISLQSMNMSLQSQLNEAQKDNTALQSRNNDLQREIAQLRQAVEDKERELQESQQQRELDISRIKIDVDAALLEMKNCQFKLQASEQEKGILTLRLHQKEAEIHRLRELNRPLPGNLLSALSELHLEKDASNASPHLSKAVLELLEDEQVACPFDPVPGTIKKYLKTLEVNRQESLEDGLSSDEPAVQSAWQRVTSQDSCSPEHMGVQSAASLSLGKALDLGKTSTFYVPLKESAIIQSTANVVNTHNGHEPTASSLLSGRPSISQGESPSNSNSGSIGWDVPVKLSRTTNPSSSKDSVVEVDHQHVVSVEDRDATTTRMGASGPDSSLMSCETKSVVSSWSNSSWSTFNTQDELNFRSGLAALDASIASLQKTIQADLRR